MKYSKNQQCINVSAYEKSNSCTTLRQDSKGKTVVKKLTFDVFDKCDKYIYYCNTNGIYRCNTKKKNDGFKLYYDAKKDTYFTEKYGLVNMKAVGNDTFYMLFKDEESMECSVSSALVVIQLQNG